VSIEMPQSWTRLSAYKHRTLSADVVAALAAMAMLAVSVALFFAPSEAGPSPLRFAADDGHTRTVTFADRTRLQLSPGSVVEVTFDETSRRIALLTGDATFDIGEDKRRPMIVEAGNHRIEDIGTVFNVSRTEGSTEISVVSGRVAVSEAASPWFHRVRRRLAGETARRKRIVELAGGDSAAISADGRLLSREHVEVITATWLPEDIRFHDETVAEVARRFNAYTSRPLVIEDPKLAARRISGEFHARDAAAFVNYLASLPGVAVIHDAEHIRFVAARGAKRPQGYEKVTARASRY